MNILMTSETYLPRHGGAEIHIKNLLIYLKKSGHKVTLFTNECGKTNDEKFVFRVKWKRVNLIKIFIILWRESKDVDIIHSHYSYRLATISCIIGLFRRVPVIVTLHGMGILNHPGTRFIYQVVHSTYRFLSLKLSTHVISTSEDLARFAYKYIDKKKVTIIHNGFDSNLFNPALPIDKNLLDEYREDKVILTVRRLVPKNGIHYLIETMPYIIKEIPNIKYIVVGDGPMMKFIKKRIDSLNINDNVILVGEVLNEDIPKYLKISDVSVFPSTAESSSISCVESMAMNSPVVASRVGGLIELLGKNEERGCLVKLVDWEDSNYDAPLYLEKEKYLRLSRAIINTILNKDFVRIKNARDYAIGELSWFNIVNKTINIYSNFIK